MKSLLEIIWGDGDIGEDEPDISTNGFLIDHCIVLGCTIIPGCGSNGVCGSASAGDIYAGKDC